MSPHTTKRRTATSLKTKHNQNDQKIELYGNPTTKQLKKRLEGGVDRAAGAERTSGKVVARG